MTFIDSLSVKLKLLLIIMLASLAGLLLSLGALYIYDRHKILENLINQTTILARIIADRSTAALSFNDRRLAEENLSALSAQPAVQLACIYDQNKMVFSTFSPAKNPVLKCPSPPNIVGKVFIDDDLHLTVPVLLNQKQIGLVYIVMGLDEVQSRLSQYVVVAIIIILVVSLFVYLLSMKLQQPILIPLMQLTEAAKTIAKNRDYSIRVAKQSNDEIGIMVEAFNDMLKEISIREQERDRAEMQLQQHREHLEELVAERTSELQTSNDELESFCYSVSHDLRAPLRAINGFSQVLIEDYKNTLDPSGFDYLQRVRAASVRMGQLIDDLLNLSRTTRRELSIESVDIGAIATDVVNQFISDNEQRSVNLDIEEHLMTRADPHLLRILLENLLGNAWKYTSKVEQPIIKFSKEEQSGRNIYYVRDNGAGFDMNYMHKLFRPFQRLHQTEEFEGTGIGLAIVERIVQRHGGKIWAESRPDQGATFYFTLGTETERRVLQNS
jgi:signal transduction histidine kinase